MARFQTYPNGNTDTLLDVDARLHNPSISIRLHFQFRFRHRDGKPHIQLGIRDLDAQISKPLQHLGQSICIRGNTTTTTRRSFRSQMRLQTHTVDLYAIGLDEFQDAQGAEGFVVVVFEVVVVVVEFCVGACVFGSQAEGDGDEGFTDGVVED